MATRNEKINEAYEKHVVTNLDLISAKNTKELCKAKDKEANEAFLRASLDLSNLREELRRKEHVYAAATNLATSAASARRAAYRNVDIAEFDYEKAHDGYSDAVASAKDDTKHFGYTMATTFLDFQAASVDRVMQMNFMITKQEQFPYWPGEFKDVAQASRLDFETFTRKVSWEADVPLQYILETPRTSREVMAYKDGHAPSCIWFKHIAYCNLKVSHSHWESDRCYKTWPRGCNVNATN